MQDPAPASLGMAEAVFECLGECQVRPEARIPAVPLLFRPFLKIPLLRREREVKSRGVFATSL